MFSQGHAAVEFEPKRMEEGDLLRGHRCLVKAAWTSRALSVFCVCHLPDAWENRSFIYSFMLSSFLSISWCQTVCPGTRTQQQSDMVPVLTEQAPQSGGCNLPTVCAVSANRYHYQLPEVREIREISPEEGMF